MQQYSLNSHQKDDSLNSIKTVILGYLGLYRADMVTLWLSLATGYLQLSLAMTNYFGLYQALYGYLKLSLAQTWKKLSNVYKWKSQRFKLSSKLHASQQRMTKYNRIKCGCGILNPLISIVHPLHSHPSSLKYTLSIIYIPSFYLNFSLSILLSPSSTYLPPPSVKIVGFFILSVLRVLGFTTKYRQMPLTPLPAFSSPALAISDYLWLSLAILVYFGLFLVRLFTFSIIPS